MEATAPEVSFVSFWFRISLFCISIVVYITSKEFSLRTSQLTSVYRFRCCTEYSEIGINVLNKFINICLHILNVVYEGYPIINRRYIKLCYDVVGFQSKSTRHICCYIRISLLSRDQSNRRHNLLCFLIYDKQFRICSYSYIIYSHLLNVLQDH